VIKLNKNEILEKLKTVIENKEEILILYFRKLSFEENTLVNFLKSVK
jgi:hypothetical protein